MATIALGQMNAGDNAAANLEKIAQLAAQAAARNADLLVLPEYAMAYPQKGQPFPSAQALNGPFVIGLRTLAKRHRMYILCGILEYSDDSKPYNTVVLLDRYGEIVCIHRKNHMYDTMKYRESEHFLLGNDLFQTVDTDFGRLGVMICYEVRFPELARIQVLDGAQLLIVCAAFVTGPSKALQWHTLLSARAIENGVFVCGCNHVKPKVFLGESCAYAPDGELLAKMAMQEGVQIVPCNLDAIPIYREKNPAILQRRAELYGFVYKSDSYEENSF